MRTVEPVRTHEHATEEPVHEREAEGRRKIMRKAAASGGGEATASPGGATSWSFGDAINAGIHGGGHALPDTLRTRFETSLGTDLGGVRVHTDGAAAQAASAYSARAFATGNDVVMGAGQYQPDTQQGQWLLAHEVAHTVQQRGAATGPQMKKEVSERGDACEVEADRAASAMVVGAPAQVSAAGGGTVMRDPIDWIRQHAPSLDDIDEVAHNPITEVLARHIPYAQDALDVYNTVRDMTGRGHQQGHGGGRTRGGGGGGGGGGGQQDQTGGGGGGGIHNENHNTANPTNTNNANPTNTNNANPTNTSNINSSANPTFHNTVVVNVPGAVPGAAAGGAPAAGALRLPRPISITFEREGDAEGSAAAEDRLRNWARAAFGVTAGDATPEQLALRHAVTTTHRIDVDTFASRAGGRGGNIRLTERRAAWVRSVVTAYASGAAVDPHPHGEAETGGRDGVADADSRRAEISIVPR
ncbi:MAG: DUF4157 domain-containing protein [Deltaproteobacteria bacterium]|nr:DUF4157 domain-containing protein [Deltaproteobacteria bacterium]